jgi:hypothetical protein
MWVAVVHNKSISGHRARFAHLAKSMFEPVRFAAPKAGASCRTGSPYIDRRLKWPFNQV